MRRADEQLDLAFEAQGRDQALNLIEHHRSDIVGMARAIAADIDSVRKRVTSPEVLAELRRLGYSQALDQYDRRFMGAVFRAGSGWKRIGWEPTGSHCRPVAIWTKGGSA